MNIIDLIEKKVAKQELSKEEIYFVVNGFVSGKIKDYQMASFLMATRIQDFTDQETFYLTEAFIDSGATVNLDHINKIKLDKHSTGGVGDKISMIILPILSALDIVIPKISGRGLQHTGGTVDKLESVNNLNCEIDENTFKKQVEETGIAIIAQSSKIVPADQKIYALRDVTATVSSVPLIAASIMSKKLVTGADYILIDVKCGNGAFMQTLEQAQLLSEKLVAIGNHFGKKTFAQITNMSSPLGKMIGNKNEVLEAISIHKGKGPKLLTEFAFDLVALVLKMTKGIEKEEALKMIAEVIETRKSLNKFYQLLEAQGGDISPIKSDSFWNPKYKYEHKAEKDGFIKWKSAMNFGKISVFLGAGRLTKEDKIDSEAGIELKFENSESVKAGETIFVLYSSNPIDVNKFNDLIKDAYSIEESAFEHKMFLDLIS